MPQDLEAGGASVDLEAQGPAVPSANEGEQTTEGQIRALVEDLTRQNEALGGYLLLSVPVSDEDSRQVLLFRTTLSPRDIPGTSAAYGVHPDKGPIEALQPKGDGVARFVYEYDSRRKTFGEGANDFTFGQLDENNKTRGIENNASFERWTTSFNTSKQKAIEAFREDQAKRQFLPKALETVRASITPAQPQSPT